MQQNLDWTYFFRMILAVVTWIAAAPGWAETGSTSFDLSGHWEARLDPGDEGLAAHWQAGWIITATSISLPGSLASDGLGAPFDPQSGRYGQTAVPYLKWPGAGYTDATRVDELGVLVASHFYRGAAWYQREFEIPDAVGNRVWQLQLERVKWTSRCWIDGQEVTGKGTRSLYTPHEYTLGPLAPGSHRITLRIDNRPPVNIGIAGHGYGMETEPLWLGVAGAMRLTAQTVAEITDLRVLPASDRNSVLVRGNLVRSTSDPVEVRLSIRSISDKQIIGQAIQVCDTNVSLLECQIACEQPARPWDEFHPELYELVVECIVDSETVSQRSTRFGLRTIRRDGQHLLLNDHRLFLRGNVDCAIHPDSDTPPTDRAWWERVLGIHKQAGFNHIRFHTWCPPDIAFTVADELGLYLQVETAYWVDNWIHETEPFPPRLGEAADVDNWVREEALRIIRTYEHHPSFVMFCIGNEFGMGSNWDVVGQITEELNDLTDNVLVSGTTARKTVPHDEYWVTHAAAGKPTRGIGPAHTNWDFGTALEPSQPPVISHETGQRPSWPDYASLLPTFTGVLRPGNLERIRTRTEAARITDHTRRAEASARFALIQYKAEHEGMRRTADLAGYQLLMLHDFTGQGEALVGLLDCFYRPKPGITLEAIRSWNGPTAPLARFAKYVWNTTETFTAQVQVSHYSPQPLLAHTASWQLTDNQERIVAEGQFPATDIAAYALTDLGSIAVPLNKIEHPTALSLAVRVGDSVNTWHLWVYPPAKPTPDTSQSALLITDSFDGAAQQKLADGGRVLLLTHGRKFTAAKATRWQSTYWTGAWGWGDGLGLMCEPAHPALAGFPTELHSDWQWHELMEGGECLRLPSELDRAGAIVEQISDFHTPAREVCLYEARVGAGSLLICALDVTTRLDERQAAAALRGSLCAYAASPAFQPKAQLTPDAARAWLSAP